MANDVMKTLSEQLSVCLETTKLSASQIARLSGIHRKKISKLKNGEAKALTISELDDLSKALKIPAANLLYGEEGQEWGSRGVHYTFQKVIRECFEKAQNQNGLIALDKLIRAICDAEYDRRLEEIAGYDLGRYDACMGDALPDDSALVSEYVHK